MKQFPNNLKFKKYHKVNKFYSIVNEKKIFFPLDGEYGLQAIESGRITFKQIESCRRTIKRGLSKIDNLWIKIFTNIPITKKPSSSRMGKGKGSVSYWVAAISRGQILFEISVSKINKALFILKKAKSKLPIKTKFIKINY